MAWGTLLFYFPILQISNKYESKVLNLKFYKYEHNTDLGHPCLNKVEGAARDPEWAFNWG